MSQLLEAPSTREAGSATQPGWAALAVVLLGTFVTFLDFFIVNVGLPSIQSELHAGTDTVSLVVAGYGLTFAVGMVTGGRLGDRYGRRRMFAVGLALFTLTSLACGLAPTAGVLVVSRVLQGLAGALVTPQVLAILGTTYDGERRAKAFAAYGFAMGIAGVLGQLIGGALIEADVLGLGWRSIFLINVPVGIVALALVRRHVPESFGSAAPLDPVGAVLLMLGLTAVVLPLVEGHTQGWPLWCWAMLGAAPVVLGGFVVHQRARRARGRAPIVDLHLFASRSFGVGSLVAMVFAMVPSSFFFVLAIYLQEGRGLDPLESGLVFAAVGVGYFASMMIATPLAERLGASVLTLGAVVVALGCGLLAVAAHAAVAEILPGLAVVGFGIGLVLVPVTALVLARVEPAQAGAGAGVLSTAQQVGGALGVAVMSTVFFRYSDVAQAFVVALLVLVGIGAACAAMTRMLVGRE